MKFSDLFRNDHSATTAKDLDPGRILLDQKISHVLEKLIVPSLIGRHCDGIGIFLDGGIDDLFSTTIVPEMNYLSAMILKNTTNDVDGGIVAIKE